MRVLVADDDRTATTILARTLTSWSLDVTVVDDGEKAWTVISKDGPPSLAILDWMMPTLDGPELCRRIRANPATAPIYVMLLTSRSAHADLVAGLEAGADDYLVKPFDLSELRARVHVGMRVATLQERLADRVAELQAALTSVKQLSGLLPICSYCKRIRSDKDYWEQVDSYIAHHSEAEFSHGICPTCYTKVMEELDEVEAQRRGRKP
jgi:sigma-B regulation protein RsbU (phosphoserine phosphatase)